MKRTTLRTSSLALAAILVLGFADISQARGHGGWDDAPCYNAPISPEQQEKAEKIFSSHYEKMDAIRHALITKRAELAAQMSDPSPDKAKIENLSKEIDELRGKMFTARTDLRAQLDKAGMPMGYSMSMHHGGYGHGGYGGCWR